MKRLALHLALGVGLALTAFQPALAAADAPDQYAARWPLQLPAGAGLVRLPLPAEVLTQLQTADLRDLRVFNGAGQPVPLALDRSSPETRVPAPPPIALPALPILADAQTGTATAGNNLSLRIEDGPGGRVVRLDTPPAGASAPAATLVGALIDTREQEAALQAIELDADWPAARPFAFRLHTSSDLRHWQPLGDVTAYRGADGTMTAPARVELHGDVLQGRYAVHQSFWPAGAPLALEETPYHLDVDKAKALLAEAGYGDGLSFEMDVINQYPYPDIAQAIQASMAKGGVEVKLVMSDQRALIGKYRARNHQAAIVYWGPDYFDIHSNAGAFAWSPNPGSDSTFKTPPWRNNWDIPELTRLTEALAVETDPEVRRKGYMEMQADYQANAPIITMLQRSDVAVMKKSVDGLVVGPLMFQFVLDKVTKQ